ncbi:MAG: prolipoprotein diacylglyceryl transferase [Clostridia bacterium]
MLADIHWTGKVKSVAFSVFGQPIAWYGIIITAAMLIGLFLGIKRAKKVGLSSDDMLELFMIAIPLAVIAARLGYVFAHIDVFFKVENFGWDNFVDIINLRDGGLTIMTGVPGGILGGFIWSKWRKVDFIYLADAVAPVILVSQALGRWGNFFNQEIYGMAVTNPSWQFFPYAVYITREGGFHQAAFFYEMVLNLVFFAAIVIVLRRLKVKGAGITMYVMGYTFVRFLMGFVRNDKGYMYDTVNTNQIFTIIVAVLAAAVLALLIIREQKKGAKVWYSGGIPQKLYPIAKAAKTYEKSDEPLPPKKPKTNKKGVPFNKSKK